MIQFLNNIWIALSTENPDLINMLLIPAGIIENTLLMLLFLNAFCVKSSFKQKLKYIFFMEIVTVLNLFIVPSPFNVILNYVAVLISIKLIFKLTWLKSLMALIFSTFIFGLVNILMQKPYLNILEITLETFSVVPIYRILYLFMLYFILGIICLFLKNFKNIRIDLQIIDNLDKHTIKLLCINICIGFLTLILQLITTAYYINIVPIFINILNFLLLISFLVLSIYSFNRVIKLSDTRRDLQSAEEYNKSLEILYDKVKGFKHDFDNIISTINGFIENNDMDGLKPYFEDVKKDCKITNNLSLLNPRIINNPGIYSLLNNKYFKATNAGIKVDFYFFLDLNTLPINTYKFSRILGILLDNAIEEAEKCKNKILKVSFRREQKNNRAIILIENTYSNKNVDIEEIFKKGISGKENHSGIGLWEVKNYVKRSKNLDLFTSKNNKFFKQELDIYDIENVSTAN